MGDTGLESESTKNVSRTLPVASAEFHRGNGAGTAEARTLPGASPEASGPAFMQTGCKRPGASLQAVRELWPLLSVQGRADVLALARRLAGGRP